MKSPQIVYVSSLPPTACGVAEYTDALANAMRGNAMGASLLFVRLDSDAGETLQDDGRFTINPCLHITRAKF